jgi:hypothetical protein
VPLVATALTGALWANAVQAATLKVVRYHGYSLDVPSSWPVYDLARNPQTCVRFDRHAVYLGAPSPSAQCPATAIGRTEAILVTPLGSLRSAPISLGPRSTRFTVASAGVLVTATWGTRPGAVARALNRRSLPVATAAAPRAYGARAYGPRAARTAQAGVYTGRGFDVCSTPSTRAMTAWGSSPYRGIGIYIGGVNMACSQPNLTASWVSTEVTAGWHLILTYVGLQAPSNSCGCASISPSQASSQGAAAANDAVAHAQALGIGAGNAIYDDMEAYTRGGSNTPAVLTYLSAWTQRLHALGYVSGVYGNANSAMTDFINAQGTGFAEPDDIWFAQWNGQQAATSGYIPAGDWANHQRIHQYSGSYNDTYGGVTLNIDGDYVDAATVVSSDASVSSVPTTPPSLSVSPSSTGGITLSASWAGANGVTAFQFLAENGSGAMTPIGAVQTAGGVTRLSVKTAAPYYEVQALGPGNEVLGISPAVALPPHLMVYGKSAFVPAGGRGLGGVPVGCYTGNGCAVTTTITAGRTVVARTGAEPVGADSASVLFFRLTPRGSALLARNHLPVKITVRDTLSGQSATVPLTLIPFVTSGRAATRHLSQPGAVKVVGLTDFVSQVGVGGILAGCVGVPACSAATTLSVGSTVIARTGPELIGENEVSYLIFTLTRQGRAMLARARGNHLTARLTLTSGAGSATANIALVEFF